MIVGKSVLEFKRDAEGEEKSKKCFGFVQTFRRKAATAALRAAEVAGHGDESTGDVSLRWRRRRAAVAAVFEPGGGVLAGLVSHHDADHGDETDGQRLAKEAKPSADIAAEPAAGPKGKSIENELQSLKWNLWHGNVDRALERIEDLQWELELTAGSAENRRKLLKQLGEFNGYIQNNREFIPNYGERYRNGERISTGFAESTVNQVVSKRMVKRQQMAWTERGAQTVAANADPGDEWRIGRDIPPLVPAVPARTATGTEGGCLSAPVFSGLPLGCGMEFTL